MSNESVIYLSDVRLSFPHLIEPQRQVNQTTGKERISYNAEFILPQSNPGLAEFMRVYGELALTKWGEHANQVMQLIQQDRKLRCYGSGDEKVNKKTFLPYDGYQGQYYITAGRDTPPQVIQADGTPVDPQNTMAYQQLGRLMYGGCRVNAAIKPWLQDNTHGRGVRCDLVAVQYLKDDEAFGEGNVDASGMFGKVIDHGQVVDSPTAPMPGAPFPGTPTGVPQAPVVPGLPPFMGGSQ